MTYLQPLYNFSTIQLDMHTFLLTRNFSLFFLIACFLPYAANALQVVSTESDPDAFIQDAVNVINGDYCEAATDLVIAGPDALLLQRFYNSKNPLSDQPGGWRILPERFLIIGRDPSDKTGNKNLKWTCAFAGERSGGILPYCGWTNAEGSNADPLRIDQPKALGMVNTYTEEINGQTNHHNNCIFCKGNACELTLGDGTTRLYQKVERLPNVVLGEELIPLMAAQIVDPEYFLLTKEQLPSGNQLFYSYNDEGRLTLIEMKNKTEKKILSWIRFSYEFHEDACQVHIETSDVKILTYHFALEDSTYQLKKVEGSHIIPIAYDYREALIRKSLPEGRFIEIEYENGKVKTLKSPHPLLGKSEITHSFVYGKDYTDVFDALGTKTRYLYDKNLHLTTIERYDEDNKLYRTEKKFWGTEESDAGFLLAKTIEDGNGCVHSYRSFQYDHRGNVTEERQYGNLTGKQEVALQVSSSGKLLNPEEECSVKTFEYSTDGFNLLTKMGDCKGNQTLYIYKTGTNLLTKKLIFAKSAIKRRTFHTYNTDAVCIKTIEDDGSSENEKMISAKDATERHIKEIKPKESLPGVGLPEIIEEKVLDLNTHREILIKKLVNTYDNQSNLLTCTTYDANNQYAFIETQAYNHLGQVILKIDRLGKEIAYTYDFLGNQISIACPLENKFTTTVYDFQSQPIEIIEEQFTLRNSYDLLGRKVSSTDRFGNSTYYEYDAFHRLTKVTYPEVLDENHLPCRPTFTYTYDIFGNAITTQDPKGFITTKSYNLRGDPTKISYPDGSFELFKYDAEGSLHRSLSRDQIITIYEYDYLGRPIYEESFTVVEEGSGSFLVGRTRKYSGFRCTYDRQKNGIIKQYYYDFAGRLSSVVENEKDPHSHLTEFIYDSLSRVHQKKVWFDIGPQDFARECFTYDLLGNVLEKRIEDAQGNFLLSKGFIYNSQNLCIEEYFFENGIKNSILKSTYNSEGEPISYLDAMGQETLIVIGEVQNTLGQTVLKKTLINPLGIQTEIEFDALSRIYSIIKKDSLGKLLSSQKILYDSLGNKSCEIHDQIVDGKALASQKMRWNYGPMGRLEEENFLGKQTCYNYNSLGKLIGKTAQGKTIHYNYTKDGKLHKVEAEGQINNRYSYDRHGNVISAHSLGTEIKRSYDDFNQLVKEIIKDGESLYGLEYAYDRKGRIKKITLPDQSAITYEYDAVFGREVKRISPQGEVLYTHKYDHYDQQGKLQKETGIGAFGTKEYTYNLNGQKINTKNDFYAEDCKRDPLRRLTAVNDNQYSYDNLSQLISEKNKIYTSDSLNNRLQVNTNELLYNNLNQLVSHSKTTFSYDSQGNLLKKNSGQ